MIYVYSQANCSGCVLLKNQLKQASIPFTEVRVDQDPEALAFMKGQNHRSVPQVYTEGITPEEGTHVHFYIGTKFADVHAYLSKQT